MNYCHVSQQIDNHANALGIEMQHELYLEQRQIELLKMAKRKLESLGRFHSRAGIKPSQTGKAYLNGYSHQYARENIIF